MNVKIEKWNENEIRFVEKDGEWWAVLKDVCESLDLTTKGVGQRLDDEVISNYPITDRLGRIQEMLVINEEGIYETVFSSRKPEAKEFKKWVFKVIKELRKQTGLEVYQIFRMLDKEHQKEAMEKLKKGISEPIKIDYIKANTISNKTVSTLYGYPKMIKKDNMTPEMLEKRQSILSDTVDLMTANNKFNLNVSISEKIREKYN